MSWKNASAYHYHLNSLHKAFPYWRKFRIMGIWVGILNTSLRYQRKGNVYRVRRPSSTLVMRAPAAFLSLGKSPDSSGTQKGCHLVSRCWLPLSVLWKNQVKQNQGSNTVCLPQSSTPWGVFQVCNELHVGLLPHSTEPRQNAFQK